MVVEYQCCLIIIQLYFFERFKLTWAMVYVVTCTCIWIGKHTWSPFVRILSSLMSFTFLRSRTNYKQNSSTNVFRVLSFWKTAPKRGGHSKSLQLEGSLIILTCWPFTSKVFTDISIKIAFLAGIYKLTPD